MGSYTNPFPVATDKRQNWRMPAS